MFYDSETLHSKMFQAFGRHHGRRGFPRGGHGFMGGPGGGLRWGRKLGSPDLQVLILALLNENPAHGYELIKTIEERSGGFYAPSPGMIYPSLTLLEDLGYASVEQDGTRKLYRITPEGEAHLAANRAAVDEILEVLSRIGGRMNRVREAFEGVEDVDATGDVRRAYHALRHALRSTRGASADETRRIAHILEAAAKEILGS